ncbi:PKD domain-containing protein, partial [Candidatus Altiarchaeota archaeon]
MFGAANGIPSPNLMCPAQGHNNRGNVYWQASGPGGGDGTLYICVDQDYYYTCYYGLDSGNDPRIDCCTPTEEINYNTYCCEDTSTSTIITTTIGTTSISTTSTSTIITTTIAPPCDCDATENCCNNLGNNPNCAGLTCPPATGSCFDTDWLFKSGDPSCCGDDGSESYVDCTSGGDPCPQAGGLATGGAEACCSSPTDCAWTDGLNTFCCDALEGSGECGTCSDGIDNDCDGDTDCEDIDCDGEELPESYFESNEYTFNEQARYCSGWDYVHTYQNIGTFGDGAQVFFDFKSLPSSSGDVRLGLDLMGGWSWRYTAAVNSGVDLGNGWYRHNYTYNAQPPINAFDAARIQGNSQQTGSNCLYMVKNFRVEGGPQSCGNGACIGNLICDYATQGTRCDSEGDECGECCECNEDGLEVIIDAPEGPLCNDPCTLCNDPAGCIARSNCDDTECTGTPQGGDGPFVCWGGSCVEADEEQGVCSSGVNACTPSAMWGDGWTWVDPAPLNYARSCCGDDGGENYEICQKNAFISWSCTAESCCDDQTDCVSPDGVCSENEQAYNVSSPDNDTIAYCSSVGPNNLWTDCDQLSGNDPVRCSTDPTGSCSELIAECDDCWVASGEPGVGEYDAPGVEECCGDDANERYNFRDDVADVDDDGLCENGDDITDEYCVGGSDIGDFSCCNSTKCVYNGECFIPWTTSFELEDVDGDGVDGEVCMNGGFWEDCDANLQMCEGVCGFKMISGGENESTQFGEYDTGNSTECCGDDFGEDYKWFVPADIGFMDPPDWFPCNTGNCSNGTSENFSDRACCNDSEDCVFQGECYTGISYASPLPRISNLNDPVRGLADVNFDGVVGAFCDPSMHRWMDCDASDNICQDNCNYTWLTLTYPQPWPGEFSTWGHNPSCCGDDVGEYYINSTSFVGGDESCCNTSSACAWGNASGVFCCHGNESSDSSCGTCTDGVDNDCDGLTDDWDPDCFLPPVAVASAWNVSGLCLENATVENYSIHVPSNEPGLNATGIVGEPFFFCDDNQYFPPGQNISRDRDQGGQNITVWAWNFNDSIGSFITDPASADVNHTYDDPGFYNVSLWISDNDAPDNFGQDNFSVYVNVSNVDPVAVINGSFNRSGVGVVWNMSKDASVFGALDVIVGENITFNGSLSYDLDEGGFEITSYSWEFNDSNITCPNFPGQLTVGSNESEYHSFCDVGMYNVSLYVEDDDSNLAQNISPGNDSTWMLVKASSLRPLVYVSAWNGVGGCDPVNYSMFKGNNTWYTTFIFEPVYFCDNWWNLSQNSSDSDEEGYTILNWSWSVNTSEFNFTDQWPSYT